METLEKLDALNKARTRGKWNADYCGDVFSTERKVFNTNSDPDEHIASTSYWTEGNPNAAFIVTLANCADEIIAVLRAAVGIRVYVHDSRTRAETFDAAIKALEARLAEK